MAMAEMRDDSGLKAAAISLPAFDSGMEAASRRRLDQLTKPQGSLGRLEDIAAWVCGWQKTLTPRAARAVTLIFAGNHGVTAQGVSAYPPEVTAQMVANFFSGGAAINQLCAAIPSSLQIIPLALDTPTQDFTKTAAMTAEECAQAFNAGQRAVPEHADIVVLGEMGIGNTTSAAAVCHALCGGAPEDWVGTGTGVDTIALRRKRDAVAGAAMLHKQHCTGPLSLLRHVGGRELAAMAGAVWRTRELGIPVILDGYVVTAAAAPLRLVSDDMLSHCMAGHMSTEPGHALLLRWLGMEPLLDLRMRLGEGSGAQIALAVVRSALATFTGMATFESASVAGRHG
jgi:nicotinate-nucleotide--dimethylbenzimidazole phosphoribosyltransferase